jgi:hypothetical protein
LEQVELAHAIQVLKEQMVAHHTLVHQLQQVVEVPEVVALLVMLVLLDQVVQVLVEVVHIILLPQVKVADLDQLLVHILVAMATGLLVQSILVAVVVVLAVLGLVDQHLHHQLVLLVVLVFNFRQHSAILLQP